MNRSVNFSKVKSVSPFFCDPKSSFSMNRFILFCSVLALTLGLQAQDLVPTVQLQSDLPEAIEARLVSALVRNGIQIDELAGTYLDVTLDPMRENRIEGMQSRYVATYQLGLTLRMQGNGRIIGSAIKGINASGKNAEEAKRQMDISTAVNQAAEELITAYNYAYGTRCAALLQEAQLLSGRETLKALAIVDAIPAGSPCHADAQTARLQYYNDYQAANCKLHLELARRQMALNAPAAALDELAKIDPTSDCAAEARSILEEAANLRETQQLAKAQFLRQVYQNQVQVEQARTQVISELVRE